MDNNSLWQIISDIQSHTSIMNSELGKCQTDIAWLKASWWELLGWMKAIVGGIAVGIILNIYNIVISKKNGKFKN